MIKALFFDIDGTLVSFNTHKVAQSTIEGLNIAKERGIKIFISTGRPLSFINNLEDIEHLIDGYITTNGSYNFMGKSVISMHSIPKEEVLTLVDYLNKHEYPAILVGTDNTAVINHKPIVDRIVIDTLNITNIDFSITAETVLQQDILQITPFITQEQQDIIMPQIPHCASERWHPEFIDTVNKQASKGKALSDIVAYNDLLISETMAFGDGGNDISMLLKAGVGVAMGNANDNVKAMANYVTSSADDDGIYKALKHFEVI
ncbi:MAG: Cof-type HAD-IIB family hydrolase [Prevotella nanceiensis]|jgi:cof-like hydrolase|uniref:Cof-type HAD-IIB family hydrolase n=1 Tax=Hoylesella nanceiensis TaxID=425941 RepID=UPI001CB412D1|nr:Cof-type HAD-IIB family hydrolase [Hoylesella nanceiensis]MBF1437947.1 Cof-type HAD-IIB family hydrolase [Hoylesella nanceiensis]